MFGMQYEFHFPVLMNLAMDSALVTAHKLGEIGDYCINHILPEEGVRVRATSCGYAMHEATVFEMAPATINSRKSHAEITGGDAFVKGTNTTLRINTFDALFYGHLHFGIIVQLQTCFNKPNWICYGGGDKTSTSCAHYVYLRVGTTLRTPPITCGCDLLRNMVVLSLRLCSGRSSSDDAFVEPGGSTTRGGVKKAVELCNRVLTTSRGHVTTAPTVPAVLQTKQRRKLKNF
uniref:Uncharacterized protein n=1 Tax=Glossina palpalis gambiensis TaxID=67801 RepID=A0A1B0B4M7_9MUSC